ncbi:hypothetical protein CAC42_791 [Sphaceloma murrayae]|uniref:Uncharacterized protein n=1 Tax=Sphaceloma murrayae TaxID=2082308 RepID=A0A2K1QKT1_9PEZI|nr:hypothetical protein CAC42_791 [Sphaceloma murrayae]
MTEAQSDPTVDVGITEDFVAEGNWVTGITGVVGDTPESETDFEVREDDLVKLLPVCRLDVDPDLVGFSDSVEELLLGIRPEELSDALELLAPPVPDLLVVDEPLETVLWDVVISPPLDTVLLRVETFSLEDQNLLLLLVAVEVVPPEELGFGDTDPDPDRLNVDIELPVELPTVSMVDLVVVLVPCWALLVCDLFPVLLAPITLDVLDTPPEMLDLLPRALDLSVVDPLGVEDCEPLPKDEFGRVVSFVEREVSVVRPEDRPEEPKLVLLELVPDKWDIVDDPCDSVELVTLPPVVIGNLPDGRRTIMPESQSGLSVAAPSALFSAQIPSFS